MTARTAIRWILLSIPAIALILVVAAYLVMQSPAFHRFLLAKITQKASQASGAHVQIAAMSLRWYPFTADFDGITARSPQSSSQTALFTADKLRVGLRLRPLLQRKVYIDAIELDHPVVNLRVDERGQSDLPHPPANSPSGFTVEVQRVAIRDGVLNYNDESIPLSAELQDFALHAVFDPATDIYKGSASYRHGLVVAKGLNSFEHNLEAHFAIDRQELTLNPLRIATPRSQMTLHAALRDYARPKVDGEYDATVGTPELGHILQAPNLPSGDVHLVGTFHYEYSTNQPFLGSATLAGKLDSKAILARVGQIALPVHNVHADYRLSGANLRVEDAEGEIFDGFVSANAEILQLSAMTRMRTRVNVIIRGLSLQRASAALPPGSRGNITLLGTASLSAQASWAGTEVKRASIHSTAAIAGPMQPSTVAGSIPVNGALDITYDGARQTASVAQAQLQTGKTKVSLTGVLSQHSNLSVDANTSDLHELASLVTAVTNARREPAKAAPHPGAPELYGSAQFTGQILGAPTDPRVRGQLSATNLSVEGTKWQSVRSALDLSSSKVQLSDGYLRADPEGTITFSGGARLQHWSPTPSTPLNLYAKVGSFPVLQLEQLAKLQYPVTGNVTGEVWLAGSEQQPQGHGSLQLTHLSAWSQPVDLVKIDFQASKQAAHATGLVRLAAGAVNASLTYFPASRRYQATLTAPGINLQRVELLQKSNEVPTGILKLSASGDGTLESPQVHVSLQIPDLQIAGQTFSNTLANFDLAGRRLQFTADSSAVQSYVHSQASIDLQGDYPATANLQVRELPIDALLAKYVPAAAQDLHAKAEIQASLSGPLKKPQELTAEVNIPDLQVAYKSLAISNDGPIRVKYTGGVAQVEQAAIRGDGTELRVHGVIPVKSAAPMQLYANGNVDLRLLQMFMPDADTSGKLDLDLHVGGKISEPVTQGQIRIENAALNTPSLPVGLSAINGEMSVTDKRLTITALNAVAGGGSLSATGSLIFPQGVRQPPEFNVSADAKSVRAHANGIRSTLDGNAQLTGTFRKSLLTGQVLVDRLSFQPGFDLGTFMKQFGGAPLSGAPSPFLSNMKLNVSVQSTRNLNLASNQLSIEGSADLTVTGPAANPVILGRIALTGGEVFFMSKRFEIQSGSIAFANPVQTEPVVNLYVNTTVQQYKITMNFEGPIDRLKTNYISDPPLPPVDIINLLAFGQTAAQSASAGAVPASVGAESVLANGVTGQLAKGIQSLTGITQLTINPLSNTSQDPASQLAVQQRISGNVLVTFSTDITTTQNQAIQLEYQPRRNITISILRDEFGGYGLDVQWHKVF